MTSSINPQIASKHITDYRTRKQKKYRDIQIGVGIGIGITASVASCALSIYGISTTKWESKEELRFKCDPHTGKVTQYTRTFKDFATPGDTSKFLFGLLNLCTIGIFPGLVSAGISYGVTLAVHKMMLRQLNPLQELAEKLKNSSQITNDQLKVLIKGVDAEERKLIISELSDEQIQSLLESLTSKEVKSGDFILIANREMVKQVTVENLQDYKENLINYPWFLSLIEARGDQVLIKAAYELILSVHAPKIVNTETGVTDLEYPIEKMDEINENLPKEFVDLVEGKNVPLSKELVLKLLPYADRYDPRLLQFFDLYIAVHNDQFSKEEIVKVIPFMKTHYMGRPVHTIEQDKVFARTFPKASKLLKNEASNPIWAKRAVKALYQSLVSQNGRNVFKWATVSTVALAILATLATFFSGGTLAAVVLAGAGVTKTALAISSCVLNIWGLIIQLEN